MYVHIFSYLVNKIEIRWLYLSPILKKLIIHRIALMMYKQCVHLPPVPVGNLFIKNSSIHGYNTRSCNLLHTKVRSSEVTYANICHGVIMEFIFGILLYKIYHLLSHTCITVSSIYQKYLYKKIIYIMDYVHNLNIVFFCFFFVFFCCFFTY